MTGQPTRDQLNEALFMSLIITFQSAAMQQMGKIKNPLTNKIERDMNAARSSIDILAMLETKTQGNLTENEKKLLQRALSEVRLNFVEELNKDQKKPKEGQQQEKTQAEKSKDDKVDKDEKTKSGKKSK